MASKKGQYKIPFDTLGNQLDYEIGYGYDVNGKFGFIREPEYHEKFEFEDTLEYVDYGKGRSSVTFTMKRLSNGKTVSFFVSEFTRLIPKMVCGKVYGRFTFTKRGANYSCMLIE